MRAIRRPFIIATALLPAVGIAAGETRDPRC